ncbi:hypothetical protein BCR44DRAFT_1281321 [Catenaria anguillulae PL171]|uniref:Uncharacterized protein n=1 Tax=Catenaria anguillulae PL171 TaxID=765915 RepID=A0A1Y2HVW2_9FUNG|nr:hypothetical protein BCR44DRAFT_1281321 [Catenaria anguillulae PL171]
MPLSDSPLPRRQHPFHHQRLTATPPNSADSLTPTSAASRASSIAPPSELPERAGSGASMRTIKSAMSASGSVVGGFRPPTEGVSAASAFLYGPAPAQANGGLRTPLESINASNEFFPAWPHQLVDRPRLEMNRRASSPPRVVRPTSVVIPGSEARRLFPSATSTLQSTIPSPPPPNDSHSPSPPLGVGATSKGTPPTVAEKLSKMSWRVKRTWAA